MSRLLTSDEIHTARLMRREGRSIEVIAQLLGRNRETISEACKSFERVLVHGTRVVTVPDHVLAERDRRLALQPRDLTAAIAGDPPPGSSALDRKNYFADTRVFLELLKQAREGKARRIFTGQLKLPLTSEDSSPSGRRRSP